MILAQRTNVRRGGRLGLLFVSILLVEDDLPLVELLRHWLGDRDIRVASSLAEAQRMIASLPPKVLILDLGLPDSLPAQTIARIRELKQASLDAVVIVITGSESNRNAAMAGGADHYFSKDRGFFAKVAGAIPPEPLGASRAGASPAVEQVERTVREIVDPVHKP